MDLFQNIKRQCTFGEPYVIANQITVTDDNEIIVTGTSQTSNPNKYPNQQPDGIYYYKEKVDNIPMLSDVNAYVSIQIYPNPTHNIINLTSNDFNSTYLASIEIYNLLGQLLTKEYWINKTMTFDLTNFANGIYVIKVTSNTLSCFYNIQKN
jgi:hypothetical protein